MVLKLARDVVGRATLVKKLAIMGAGLAGLVAYDINYMYNALAGTIRDRNHHPFLYPTIMIIAIYAVYHAEKKPFHLRDMVPKCSWIFGRR